MTNARRKERVGLRARLPGQCPLRQTCTSIGDPIRIENLLPSRSPPAHERHCDSDIYPAYSTTHQLAGSISSSRSIHHGRDKKSRSFILNDHPIDMSVIFSSSSGVSINGICDCHSPTALPDVRTPLIMDGSLKSLLRLFDIGRLVHIFSPLSNPVPPTFQRPVRGSYLTYYLNDITSCY